MSTNKIVAIIGAVVTLVAFLAILPTILARTTTAAQAANAQAYTDVEAIIKLLPLVSVIGGVGVAGLIAFTAARQS